ncbi:traB domain-containing protein [Dorcoceras hygrometricum]|uniref:TraB domain-containing protein n=1 Tax=Dorcoceras hygrometricum TaxID=472368 RepID=A0A2Z7C3H3_9LAMI|nr:traB domain-containing protein [Dorcoceras hygrometricum]
MKVSPFPPSISTPFSCVKSQFGKLHRLKRLAIRSCKVSIIPPPPTDFDFRNEILSVSTAAIAETHPELLDLAHNGTLVMINKSEYGPVPSWRSGFVEPDSIWLIGTTHTSQESASDVERVIRAVRPENVVVELCRSRQVLLFSLEFMRIFVEIFASFL